MATPDSTDPHSVPPASSNNDDDVGRDDEYRDDDSSTLPLDAATNNPGHSSESSSGDDTSAGVEARAILRSGQDRFIAIWGEMGTNWGIPRTMAEVHALLYIVGEPMCTDDIMQRLDISRGSASMSLRSLTDWGIVGRTHKRGDRKEYFRAELDVWAMFRTILRERKRREIDPVLVALYECRDLTQAEHVAKAIEASSPTLNGGTQRDLDSHNHRLDEMLEFMEMIDSLADRFISPAGRGLRFAAGLLGKVV